MTRKAEPYNHMGSILLHAHVLLSLADLLVLPDICKIMKINSSFDTASCLINFLCNKCLAGKQSPPSLIMYAHVYHKYTLSGVHKLGKLNNTIQTVPIYHT